MGRRGRVWNGAGFPQRKGRQMSDVLRLQPWHLSWDSSSHEVSGVRRLGHLVPGMARKETKSTSVTSMRSRLNEVDMYQAFCHVRAREDHGRRRPRTAVPVRGWAGPESERRLDETRTQTWT